MTILGGPDEPISPEDLRQRTTEAVSWVRARADELGLAPSDSDRVERLLAEPPRDPTATEPSEPLRRVLWLADPRGHDRFLAALRRAGATEAQVELERKRAGHWLHRLLDDERGSAPFLPRRREWVSVGKGIRVRYWSFWTAWERRQPLPEAERLEAPELGHDEDVEEFLEVDLGARVLDALERPGWEALRAQHEGVVAARNDHDVPEPVTTASIRARRRSEQEELGCWLGFFETPLLLGRTAALLGPPGAEQLLGAADHDDLAPDKESDLAVQLEVQYGDERKRIAAVSSPRTGRGLPVLRMRAVTTKPRPVLDAVADALLAHPEVRDVETERDGDVFGVRGGALFVEARA